MFNLTAGGGNVIDIGSSIPNSTIFNDNDSMYMTRTPTASDRDTWTWSCWLKRGNITGGVQTLITAGADVNNTSRLIITSGEAISYTHVDASVQTDEVKSNMLLRDSSAWYHIVLAVDTTQATAANRVRIYVNGEEVSLATANYPSQNVDTDMNANVLHTIGRAQDGTAYLDGQLAEVHFVDGSQLTPSSFGRTSKDTGAWVPIAPSVTYGDRGYHLDFADSSDYGNDVSGNNNDFTDSGFTTSQQTTDTPTNNYPVLLPYDLDGAPTLQHGNTEVSTATNAHDNVLTSMVADSEDADGFYFEITIDSLAVTSASILVVEEQINSTDIITDGYIEPAEGNMWAYRFDDGQKANGEGSWQSYGSGGTTASVINVCIKAGAVYFGIDGTWEASGDPAAGTGYAYNNLTGNVRFGFKREGNTGTDTQTWNFGAKAFANTQEAGTKKISTKTMPDPAVIKGSTSYNTLLHTGTGATNAITGLGFQPDLVWIKERLTTSYPHALFDSVRGANKYLKTDSSADEVTETDMLGSFDADGFTLGADATRLLVNQNTKTYVSWSWQMGTTPGMDIQTYTGTGTAKTETHDLGTVPELIIVKPRATAGADTGWLVYHAKNTAAPETDHLVLDTNAATVDAATTWNDTAPTSSVFTVGTTGVNVSGDTYVAYLFAGVPGFSKFGVYTGNALNDGPFVHLGFRPAFVMIKRTAGLSDWTIYDTARDTYNSTNTELKANTSGVEAADSGDQIDFLSNGFKLRDNPSQHNATGEAYVYVAFAEVPFKYSNAR